MNAVGIMQGRLTLSKNGSMQRFPTENWRQEFPVAAQIGFSVMELLLTWEDADANPLLTKEGAQEIARLSKSHGLSIPSICADYFKDRPLFRYPDGFSVMSKLLEGASRVGAGQIGIPALESSSITNKEDEREFLVSVELVLKEARRWEIGLALETDKTSKELLTWLLAVQDPFLSVYFDLGNAAALGFDIPEQIRALGSAITGVHVKDRMLRGSSVPLGSGAVDFSAAFCALHEVGYPGPFVLETPPGDDPQAAAKKYLAFVKGKLECLKS